MAFKHRVARAIPVAPISAQAQSAVMASIAPTLNSATITSLMIVVPATPIARQLVQVPVCVETGACAQSLRHVMTASTMDAGPAILHALARGVAVDLALTRQDLGQRL